MRAFEEHYIVELARVFDHAAYDRLSAAVPSEGSHFPAYRAGEL